MNNVEFKRMVIIEKMYTKGVTRKEIADRMNITIREVNRYLNMASGFRA